MIYLIVAAILVLYIASVPIRVKVKGGVDLDKGEGNISISVLHIPVLSAKGLIKSRSLTEGDLVIMQRKKKEMHLDVNKKSFFKTIKMIKNIDLSFLANLDVSDLYISAKYGSSNAFMTTMLMGTAKILFYSLVSIIKSKQKVEVTEEFVPVYNMRTFKIDFHGIFKLSVADIIYGYIAGKLKRLKKRLHKKALHKKGLQVLPKKEAV